MAVLERDPTTGILTQQPGPTGCVSETVDQWGCTDAFGLQGVRYLTVSLDGGTVYAVSSSDVVAVFDRDLETGALTQKAGTDGCVSETGKRRCLRGWVGARSDDPRSL